MEGIGSLGRKTLKALKEEGITGVARKTVSYIHTAKVRKQQLKYIGKTYKDVLFINGCDYNALPHPPRYRVQHQMEQLKANNIDCDENFYLHLSLEQVRNYRVFVIFRCPYTEELGEFIRLAKELNKTVIYDIDDLVIDTKYTDTIKYLDTMSPEERKGYDEGVRNMQKVLKMCDAAITTTERMAEELKHYVPKVFINRNTASEEMLQLSEEAYKKIIAEKTAEERKTVKLGYFSGSITHNDDFILIQPAVAKIMEKYPQTELHIAGILDIPKELEAFKERVIAHPFADWKKLPEMIAAVDINLAPLEESIFNEAKSENKWVEAALVRVPTIASNLGAFKRMIEHNKTGILANTCDEWYEGLESLVVDAQKREYIAKNAYEYCKVHCVTLYTGFQLMKFIKSMYVPNIAMVLPALNISGGIMVAFEHCKVLREHGYDVTIINDDIDDSTWCEFQGIKFPVLPSRESIICGHFDKAIATMWSTVKFLEEYSNIGKRYYLVQNFETNFYEPMDPLRIEANQKYSPKVDVQFLTISKWCEKWLKEDYEQEARYLPNGIHTENYTPVKRDFSGKVRILIEGDCGVYYKNVDESFRITNQLNHSKYEIWYMSYNAEPKDWYHVDKFLHKIPFSEVADVYRQCHILLKTSFLESFSYPPLEMMATGGYAVVVPNGGNQEYLVDGKNCLLYPCGDLDAGLAAIERINTDPILRETLYHGGLETAGVRDWKSLEQDIFKFYDC